jgi:hypothetical protein
MGCRRKVYAARELEALWRRWKAGDSNLPIATAMHWAPVRVWRQISERGSRRGSLSRPTGARRD